MPSREIGLLRLLFRPTKVEHTARDSSQISSSFRICLEDNVAFLFWERILPEISPGLKKREGKLSCAVRNGRKINFCSFSSPSLQSPLPHSLPHIFNAATSFFSGNRIPEEGKGKRKNLGIPLPSSPFPPPLFRPTFRSEGGGG